MSRWASSALFFTVLACDAQAAPQPCPKKLTPMLVTDDPTLRPSEIGIVRLSEVRYDEVSKQLSSGGGYTKSIRLEAGASQFPIEIEFDISDLKVGPIAFKFSAIGDTAAEIERPHFTSYGYQMTGFAATMFGWPAAIWVRKARSRF